MRGAILWLNGWGMTNDVFQKAQGEFSDYVHLCPDFSDVTDEDQFYEKALRALNEKPPKLPLVVIGWSMGGILAQRLACELQVSALVLISSTPCFVRSKEEAELGWADGYLRQMQFALKRNRDKVVADFRQAMFTADERMTVEYLEFSAADHWSLDALIAGLSFLRKQDVRPLLPHISCPALIVHGTADTICPVLAAEEMAKGIARAQLVPFIGCGHVPFVARERDFLKQIREVLP